MKNKYFTLAIAAGLGLTLGSCSDYLDSDYIFDERMTIEDVFSNRDYSIRWLAHAYNFLGEKNMQDICSKKQVQFNFADDMYFGDGTNSYNGKSYTYADWKYGRYGEEGMVNNSQEILKNAYHGIRQASIFLQNIDGNLDIEETERNDLKGQAYFLRAFFYWQLIKIYGPMPIVPDDGVVDYTKEYDEIATPRSSYEECTEYIVNQLEQAAALLPLSRGEQTLAEPTRGAALALRARVLLYAASPLYNGQAPDDVQTAIVNRQGEQLLPSTYDERKWARAAAAARDVMELGAGYELNVTIVDPASREVVPPDDPNGTFGESTWPNGWLNIDPCDSYRSTFNGAISATNNKELIFTRGQNQASEGINIMVIHQLPRSDGGGYNTHGMTQKQCDAYYMADGSDCPGMNSEYKGQPGYTDPLRYNDSPRPTALTGDDENDSAEDFPELGANWENVCKQYTGREPRFYASVGFNGSTWELHNANTQDYKGETPDVQVFYYRDKPDGYQTSTYWLYTGIGIKKFVHPNDISDTENKSYDTSRCMQKVPTDIRYAEVLLIYAEALNELTTSYVMPSWDGKTTYTLSRDINEMKRGIQPIRIRGGVPDYDADIYADADKFRIKLKRERQIELFAEGHRYFDLRRWLDAPNEEQLPVYGCNYYCTSEMPAEFHTPVEITALPSIFTTKMWFWPISHYEMKRNKELTQNPGWTDPE